MLCCFVINPILVKLRWGAPTASKLYTQIKRPDFISATYILSFSSVILSEPLGPQNEKKYLLIVGKNDEIRPCFHML